MLAVAIPESIGPRLPAVVEYQVISSSNRPLTLDYRVLNMNDKKELLRAYGYGRCIQGLSLLCIAVVFQAFDLSPKP